MTTPLQKLSLGSILTISGVLTITALCSRSGTAFAAGAPTPPALLIHADVKTGATVVKADGGGSSGGGGGGKSGGGGGSSTTTTAKGWAEITITNNGDHVATGLKVDYHVYTKVSTSGSSTGVTWKDYPDTYTIETLKPQEKNVTKSKPIDMTNTMTASSGGGGGGGKKGGGSSGGGSSSTSITSLVGVYLTVTMADDPNTTKPWSKVFSSSDAVKAQYKIDNPQQ